MDNPNYKGSAPTESEVQGGAPPPPYPVDPPSYVPAPYYAPPPPHYTQGVTTISGGNVGFQHPQTIHIQPTTSQATTIIVTQPARFLGPEPLRIICPNCRADVTTRTTYQSGTMTHVCCMVTFCFLCWPCAIVPYLTDCTKDVSHECPNCNKHIGTFNR